MNGRSLQIRIAGDSIAALWGVDSVPEKPGKSAVELFKALQTGEIKAYGNGLYLGYTKSRI